MSTSPEPRRPRSTAIDWLRRNLFGSVGNSLLTLAAAAVMVTIAIALLRWLVIDARWSGTDREACANVTGACWPFVWSHFDQFMYGLYPAAERWRVNLGIGVGAVLIGLLAWRRTPHRQWLAVVLVTVYPVFAGILFVGGCCGLAPVATTQWGGFFLTLVVSFCVLTASLPLGVLLALGRRSRLPLISAVCAGWVELWRAVPAVVLLFVVIIMFPLFMPAGIEVDKLVRALLALILLMSSYLAEVVRGALQGLPVGQTEAARALGLKHSQALRLIILPQALTTALPQIASQFIGLFKETTVLLIIGLYDLFGMVQTATTDPAWLGASSMATGFVFAGAFFWCCCFAMSRLSARLEYRAGARSR